MSGAGSPPGWVIPTSVLPAPQRAETTNARGRATRDRILVVARQAFSERGYRGASLNEIARIADVTMAGLVHHYGSKHELFLEVLRAYEEEDYGRLHENLPADAGAFDVLDAYAATAELNVHRHQLVQLMHLNGAESASGSHPGSVFAARHFEISRDLVAEAFKRSIAAGEVSADLDPKVYALQVVAMSEGIENQWLHDRDGIDLAGSFRTWVDDLKGRLRRAS